ncbi:hypothetical protein EDC04DRAFT_2705996 [Pisolithus marmoratus]|nr:hypothetical protein EDC04DRAFT_2705996 [Pisolithus marmoratus]
MAITALLTRISPRLICIWAVILSHARSRVRIPLLPVGNDPFLSFHVAGIDEMFFIPSVFTIHRDYVDVFRFIHQFDVEL